MSKPPLVIDTCCLSDKGFLTWLYKYRGRKIMPMMVYVEFSYFLRHRGRNRGQIIGLLKRLGIEIEAMGLKPGDAMLEAMIEHALDPNSEEYNRGWRDRAIAGHAHTAPLVVVTKNLKDFAYLDPRVLTPAEAMKRY